VRHVLLRQVEHVAVGVVGGDAGKRPCRRTLEPFHRWIFLAHAFEYRIDILDLDAEVIEAGGTAGTAWIDVGADIAVAHGHGGAGSWPRSSSRTSPDRTERGERNSRSRWQRD